MLLCLQDSWILRRLLVTMNTPACALCSVANAAFVLVFSLSSFCIVKVAVFLTPHVPSIATWQHDVCYITCSTNQSWATQVPGCILDLCKTVILQFPWLRGWPCWCPSRAPSLFMVDNPFFSFQMSGKTLRKMAMRTASTNSSMHWVKMMTKQPLNALQVPLYAALSISAWKIKESK